MKLSTYAPFASLSLLASHVVAAPASKTAALDGLHKKANTNLLAELQARTAATIQKRADSNCTCTADTVAVRKEFGSLSPAERKKYTDAVLCLQKLGANTPADLAPGAKSRYDDFIVTHIQQTMTIHYTGTFLAWHRYFTWIYEQALRDECGYTGYQPYWDWPKWADAPQDSPIFNGDKFSMSGNGEFIEHEGVTLGAIVDGVVLDPIILEPGLGGGCISTGPFANSTINLGPLSVPGSTEVGPDGGMGFNPRCLKRDVNPAVAKKYTNAARVTSLITENDNIWDFEMTMQGFPGTGDIGVHGGGHYTIGGDPGGDLFTSPGDPVFYLHHAQIDRVWTTWQALDLATRTNAISGTGTFRNEPPSANTTLETPIDLGFAGGAVLTMADLMSPTAGPFCYMYE